MRKKLKIRILDVDKKDSDNKQKRNHCWEDNASSTRVKSKGMMNYSGGKC